MQKERVLMPWENNNNSNGGFRPSNGFQRDPNKPKTNFRIGDLRSEGGLMTFELWKAERGPMVNLTIYQEIGKDPDTGAPSYEKKAPNELPRVYLTRDGVIRLYNILKTMDPSNLEYTHPLKNDKKFTFNGDTTGVSITIETEKGKRSMKLVSTQYSNKTFHPYWNAFMDLLKRGYERALYIKLDNQEAAEGIKADDNDESAVF
jgi:hypothetical protein